MGKAPAARPAPGNISLIYGAPLAQEPGMGALTIPGYLREVVERYGDAEAVVLRTGEARISWSYKDLWDRAMEVARALVACGVAKDSRVGILMTNRPEFLSSLFGIAMAGGVPVALSTFSTPAELEYLVQSSQASVLLFEQQVLKKDFGAMLAEAEPAIAAAAPGGLVSEVFPFLNRLVAVGGVPGASEPADVTTGGAVESWDQFIGHGDASLDAVIAGRAASVAPTDPGGIFFSSGTTSLPKGILHSQRAFAIQWWRWPRVFAMREPVRAWTGNGFFWSGNCAMVVGSALSTGGAVVLQRYFDAEEALRIMEAERTSFVNGRPHQWARLQEAPNWAEADLSSLHYIPRSELMLQHPTVESDWYLPMSFGTTETMTICTSYSADTDPAEYKGSCGVPLPGNMLKIIDPDTREIVPLGERGEMCIKGPTLMSGYLGKAPEDCFDEQGYYCTGDGGYVDAEGRFFWEGRLTAMIKTGGANVAPDEVDDELARYPGIRRAQTVGVPDDLLGEKVVACIVAQDGAALDSDAIVAFLKERLASFKVPREILFFDDAEMEVTGSGKVKFTVLREMAVKRLAATEETAA
ncbi:class I adenylate-forming enzyme family protein [Stakelama tenebrarum]|uniref:Acyl--CoA ligase n=1 Tax=Stakelama tenebrarum TaxID=2711215 RepID=A0A6G6Y743_9SPHN|nr:class I adenylate-forming enzyme family protein [Sphingosinithalassobacter tenebrarum]QIG80729.1 acyl--CoA ligase [Sphingosinithalassobacter tenebrarum]